jgi:FAD dependent oxidoreductase
MQLDVVIFGGGAAGLWLLDALARRGAAVLLLEADQLGSGQTIGCQGIIHGGLKYTLQGMLTPSAVQIRDMPELWRECLAGRREPDLARTRVRSPCCHLWRTDSMTSRLGMLGARVGLRVTPKFLDKHERPAALAGCPGATARLEEPVIAADSLLQTLAAKHRRLLLKIDSASTTMSIDGPGRVREIRLLRPRFGHPLTLKPRHVVLTAGKGNAQLRGQMGLVPNAMQCRPLHMVLARGELPELFGHCVDGAVTRVTITSNCDPSGRRVWQVGGQIAEDGVAMDSLQLVRHARAELATTIPGVDLRGIEWSTYRIDRAEAMTPGVRRPETVHLSREGNVLTGWPTKLALVPVLAERILDEIGPIERRSSDVRAGLEDWPYPEPALLPWDTPREWFTEQDLTQPARKAA